MYQIVFMQTSPHPVRKSLSIIGCSTLKKWTCEIFVFGSNSQIVGYSNPHLIEDVSIGMVNKLVKFKIPSVDVFSTPDSKNILTSGQEKTSTRRYNIMESTPLPKRTLEEGVIQHICYLAQWPRDHQNKGAIQHNITMRSQKEASNVIMTSQKSKQHQNDITKKASKVIMTSK